MSDANVRIINEISEILRNYFCVTQISIILCAKPLALREANMHP